MIQVSTTGKAWHAILYLITPWQCLPLLPRSVASGKRRGSVLHVLLTGSVLPVQRQRRGSSHWVQRHCITAVTRQGQLASFPIENVKSRQTITQGCLFSSDWSNPFCRFEEQWIGCLPSALVELRRDWKEQRQCVAVALKWAAAPKERISKKSLLWLTWADVLAFVYVGKQ